MSGLQVTPEEYLTTLIMSKDLFLLLEGSDDEIFFTIIANNIKNRKIDANLDLKSFEHLKKLRIETAEQIKGALGNRDKVEKVCRLVAQEPEKVQQKIVGFVDREFREFKINESLQDYLKTHKIDGRLIWSRGHSIENYLFELGTWKETFSAYPVSSLYLEAFEIFSSKFDDLMKIACSLSLAAFSEDLIKPILRSLHWKCIDIKSISIEINLEYFGNLLKTQQKLDQIRVENLLEKFQKYAKLVDYENVELARWLSHGHIGLNLIFATYGQCLYLAALSDPKKNSETEANKVNDHKSMRFTTSVNGWLKSQLTDDKKVIFNEFPVQCLGLLIQAVKD